MINYIIHIMQTGSKSRHYRVPLSGTSTFTLSSLINLFTSNLNLSGMDWVEKLKILTNTTQPLAVSTLVSAALLGEPPQILVHDH